MSSKYFLSVSPVYWEAGSLIVKLEVPRWPLSAHFGGAGRHACPHVFVGRPSDETGSPLRVCAFPDKHSVMFMHVALLAVQSRHVPHKTERTLLLSLEGKRSQLESGFGEIDDV